ncbi:FAD-dependent oxidoreductase [Siphonobacter aquaeclarae]|uniref:Por secretion system C-terminal sorting domain-containing protein n=1 Tax=Siphonobacter aquaeclarae TaxID=563176 RepID=A0A1G9RFV2_9BACT|nr:FAD-dependent oxidoreductase [Siphonobacter aquaeclarae]SDM22202.1 Por secretion system C-terminal sorting domain-containing protein [Siphonobacter aquaeclarae]
MKAFVLSPRKLIIFFFSLFFSTPALSDTHITADICIYGGTSAGVMAAYTAAKLGKTVVLIEPGTMLGGMSSGGLSFTDVGHKESITGLSREFYRRLGPYYRKKEAFQFEPHAAEEVFQSFLKQLPLVTLMYSQRLAGIGKDGTRLTSIEIESVANPAVRQTILARVFVDCTYEGDLMARAGVSYAVGREANKTYREKNNGFFFSMNNPHQFPDNIDPYIVPGQPSSGLIYGVVNGKLEPGGTGDHRIQAFNYRICLTDETSNQVPITQPGDYDPARYELLLRLMAAQPEKRSLSDYLAFRPLPNRKWDINANGPFSTDLIGENYDYPEADYQTRGQIALRHENHIRGLLYFLANDTRVSASIRQEMRKWGYPRDEYVRYNNFTPQLYVREARRMVSDYVMTEANCLGTESVDDGVAQASYMMDSHQVQRLVVTYKGKAMVKNEGDVQMEVKKPYPVSYRSIVPKESECTNLLVPVCLSSSHIAYGSIRMEPVFMQLGQASGVAAVMSLLAEKPIQQIDVSLLQKELRFDSLVVNPVILPEGAAWNAYVFPNPATTFLSVQLFGVQNEILSTQLFDTQGRSVYQSSQFIESVDKEITVNVADVPRGVYLINLQTSQRRFSKRILLR